MRPSRQIEILAVRGLSTVQDEGRPGFMHDGVPPGGFLVPELAAGANFAVGNPLGAPLLEVFGGVSLTVLGDGVSMATEDGVAKRVAVGERFEVAPSSSLRARYVAVTGGLDVPRALGGRGTLAVARLGGHEGRALARGDRIDVLETTLARALRREGTTLDPSGPVRIMAGPHPSRFASDALERLVRARFTVLASSDRTGTRLGTTPGETSGESPSRLLRGGDEEPPSAPMVRGAVQVPPSEPLIVLGPDHPTTGGYPVIAVVARRDLGRFFAHPVGAELCFTRVTLDEARALVLA